MSQSNKPVYQVVDGDISIGVWVDHGQYGPMFSIQIQRSYPDKQGGGLKYTDRLRGQDVWKVVGLLQDVAAWVRHAKAQAAAKQQYTGGAPVQREQVPQAPQGQIDPRSIPGYDNIPW
jgi:hypothetical protein